MSHPRLGDSFDRHGLPRAKEEPKSDSFITFPTADVRKPSPTAEAAATLAAGMLLAMAFTWDQGPWLRVGMFLVGMALALRWLKRIARTEGA